MFRLHGLLGSMVGVALLITGSIQGRSEASAAPQNLCQNVKKGSKADRAYGALLGLAIGDALGTTLEFTKRDTYEPLTDIVGGGPFRLKSGEWTDDTSMALCLADSLLASPQSKAVNLRDLNQRFVRWYRKGENSVTGVCFDIGNTTKTSLQHFEQTGKVRSSLTDDQYAGNGSIMRLAPVTLRWHGNEVLALKAARDQSQTTHGAPQAVEGCALLTHILLRAIVGESKEKLFNNLTFQTKSAKINELVKKKPWLHKTRKEISSSGYVYHTLEAALWCVYRTNSFKEAVLLAANLGDDADTVAAVTGQIAGALYGVTGIPLAWRQKLAWRDLLCKRAHDLFQLGSEKRRR